MKNNIKIISNDCYSILINQENLAWIKVDNSLFKNIVGNKNLIHNFIQSLSQKYNFFHEILNNNLHIKTIYFSVTNACNMNCEFCSLESGPLVDCSDDISLESIRGVIKKIIMAFNPSTIVITGGEPTTRSDIIEILDICQEYRNNCSIMLQTNGLNLTDDIIRKLVKKIDIIEISIEHFIGKGCMAEISRILERLNRYNIDIRLSYVIDKKSQSKICEAIDLCYEYNATFIFRFITSIGRAISSDILMTDSEIEKVLLKIVNYLLDNHLFSPKLTFGIFGGLQSKKACGAWGKTIGIKADGKVQMCGNLKEKIYNYGDLMVDSIDNIVCKMESKMKDKKLQSKFFLNNNKTCSECFARYFCGGACVAELENIKIDNFRCQTKKLYMLYLMFYYDKKRSIEENLIELKMIFEREDNYNMIENLNISNVYIDNESFLLSQSIKL